MEVVILPTPVAVCTRAARIVAALVRRKPNAVLGLATGETMRGVYAELARLHRDEALRFAQVTTFNLDEYVGVDPAHPASYHQVMREQLFAHVDLGPTRTHLPDGTAQDLPAMCDAYEKAIAEAGGIDLQLLGLGTDGHIGFNEPTSSLASRTRLKTLTETTRARARDSWGADGPPRHVVTMGIGTILGARRCVLLAYGPAKADAVARMIEGPLSAMIPASALQQHPKATVLIDEDAAYKLRLEDYYHAVQRDKPAWQRAEDGE